MNIDDLLLENSKLRDENERLKKMLIQARSLIPVRNSRGAGRKSKLPSEVFNKVVELRSGGFTYCEIAHRCGISKSYVSKILIREGF